MLPGLAGAAGFIGVPDAFVSYAEASNAGPTTTLAINKPSGTESGMFLVALLASGASGGVSWTGDTSWTEIYDQNNSARPSLRVAYLVAGGSEPASYTFTASSSTGLFGQILCFRGYGYDTIGSAVALIGNGSLVITGLTSAGGILIGCAASAGATSPTHSTPTGMTLVKATTLSTTAALTSWYQAVAPGATGTRTTTVAGTPANSNGILVGLR